MSDGRARPDGYRAVVQGTFGCFCRVKGMLREYEPIRIHRVSTCFYRFVTLINRFVTQIFLMFTSSNQDVPKGPGKICERCCEARAFVLRVSEPYAKTPRGSMTKQGLFLTAILAMGAVALPAQNTAPKRPTKRAPVESATDRQIRELREQLESQQSQINTLKQILFKAARP